MGKGRLDKHFVKHSCSEPSDSELPGGLGADKYGNLRGEKAALETGAAKSCFKCEPRPYICYEAFLLFTQLVRCLVAVCVLPLRKDQKCSLSIFNLKSL